MITQRILLSLILLLSSAYVYANPSIEITRMGNANGRSIVLIPGLASNIAVWDSTVEALQDDYDLRLVQLAGFAGASPVDTQGSRIDLVVKALTEHLSTEPGKDTLFIGHSLGGFLSLKMAIEAEELVNEVIIVDSLPFLAGLFMPGTSPEQAAAFAPQMAARMKTMPRSAFDAQQDASLRVLTKTSSFLPTLQQWSQQSDQAAVADFSSELLGTDLRQELSAIEQKTTVLIAWDQAMPASQDQLTALFEQQYAGLSNAKLKRIDGSFHFIMIDQKDAYLAAIMEALQ